MPKSHNHIEQLHIDAEALARAFRGNPCRFEKMVKILRRNGASDGDIVRAMSRATTLISPLRVIR